MPQDVPLEAGDTLAFTPPCLKDIDGAPSFTLRTATRREDRRFRRLLREEGIVTYSNDAIREEIMTGLEALWSPEAYEQHAPTVRDYWRAQDEFALQRKDDPDLKWEYDPEVERGIRELVERVTDSWRPLRRIFAKNAEFEERLIPLRASIVVTKWTGLDVKRELEEGYLTPDCAEELVEALKGFAKANGADPDIAAAQLFVACVDRTTLDEDTEKNSASPSPSATTPPASSETNTSEPDGSSPESTARSSKKTPETA